MINLNHECVYHCPILIEASDEEKELMKEKLYKEDILKVFELKDFNEIQINDKILALQIDFKEIEELNIVCKLVSEYVGDSLYEFGFMILFSIDYFYLMYEFIKKFYNNNREISTKILTQIKELIDETMKNNTLPIN